MKDNLITLAIHTYQKAQVIKTLLESRGIEVYLHNVNLIQPVVSSGVRVRIKESDLPAALKIIETTNLLEDAQAGINPKEQGERKKIILIPVDFSDYSKHACEMGFNYAWDIEAEVVIMHAYFTPYLPTSISFGDSFSYLAEDEEAMLMMTKKAQTELDDFSGFIKKQIAEKEWPDVPFSCILRNGIPEEEIDYFCHENAPVMIFMGTRGKNQKDIDLIGSVTAEVIDRAKVPVFAIPENTPFSNFAGIKRIAFGTSFEQKDLVAADNLFRMFKNYPVEYYFFHITSKQSTWNEIKLSGIKDYFEKQYPQASIKYDIVDANDFASNLEKFVRNNKIDVISLTTHKRNIFARMFNPSMAQKMLFHTNTPMLVLH